MKYKNAAGKPRWKASRGQVAKHTEYEKRKLAKLGLLPPARLYTIETAIEVAGL